MKVMKYSDIEKYEFIHPECQRMMSESRLTEMFENIRKETDNFLNQYNPYGCITLSETKGEEETKVYVLDGQHRLTVFGRIYKESKMDIMFFCQWLLIDKESDNEILFKRINDSLPLSILPEGLKRMPISKVVSDMKSKYGVFFVVGKGKRRPYINGDMVEEHLGECLKMLGRESIERREFMEVLEKYNEMLSKRNRHYFASYGRDVDKFYVKCEEMGGLFVGLITDYSWVYGMFGLEKKEEEKEEEVSLGNIAYRNVVYERDGHKCRVCKKEVGREEFHMGHVISRKNGGGNDASNIVLLCPSCNLSIGKQNIGDFCKKISIEWN